MLRVAPKAGEKDRTQRQNEALASAATADEPALSRRRRRCLGAASALTVDGQLLGGHRQGKQRGQERKPGGPRRRIAEPGCEQVLVLNGVENRDWSAHVPQIPVFLDRNRQDDAVRP